MKRNKTNHRVGKTGIPPYTRAKRAGDPKRPYRYSEGLRQWERQMGRKAARDDKAGANG